MQWSGNSICFFFSLSFSSFCWMCAELYEVIHLYPNRNIGFAILDQSIGPSMLYSYCLWHHMIHEAPEERELLAYPRDSKSIAQHNLWGTSSLLMIGLHEWDRIWRCLNKTGTASFEDRFRLFLPLEIVSSVFLITFNYKNYHFSHNNKLQ